MKQDQQRTLGTQLSLENKWKYRCVLYDTVAIITYTSQWKQLSHPSNGHTELRFLDSILQWCFSLVLSIHVKFHCFPILLTIPHSAKLSGFFLTRLKTPGVNSDYWKKHNNVMYGRSVVHLIKNPVTIIWDIWGRTWLLKNWFCTSENASHKYKNHVRLFTAVMFVKPKTWKPTK